MDKTNNYSELTFNITSGRQLTFDLDVDDLSPINVKGALNGKFSLNQKNITYTSNPNFFGQDTLECYVIKNKKGEKIKININVLYGFKAKSHILSLLGDELIGSDNLAIFELVKNSYDADAKTVTIKLNDLNTEKQAIVIEDNGSGMSLKTLQNVWLEIGTDFKRGKNRKISKKYKRVSLGEKGVGRLAIHKLGETIVLETKTLKEKNTSRLKINWPKLINESEYIEDAGVVIDTIPKNTFSQGQGTRITITDLKNKNWTRGDLRDLARKINSIMSPFRAISSFQVKIEANDDKKNWFDDVKSSEAILKDALYYFDFTLDTNKKSEFAKITWNYKFIPPPSFSITPVKSTLKEKKSDLMANVLPINTKNREEYFEKGQLHLKNKDLVGIGNITGRFYVYNLQSLVLTAFGQTGAIKSFVKDNSGVKIFRDGIRVYNYGEPNDDWLGLDLARVQKLGRHFSKNIVVGAIELNMADSHDGLKEKTNREGFDENYTYKKFKEINREIFELFESKAQKDRDKITAHIENLKPVKKVGLSETIRELEEKMKEKKIDKELEPLLKRVEKDYNDMRDIMLNSGMSGANLAVVFHEVEREVRFINTDLSKNSDLAAVKTRVNNLIQLLENFSPLLKQNKNILIKASELVDRAKHINAPRFGYHKVIFSSPLISGENEDFQIKGAGNLLISAVSNIIDNSIYWVGTKRELQGGDFKSALYIGSDTKNFSGPAIIIADNGPGFNIEPEDLIAPFRTTRPGGMGLGLYFVNMVMEMAGGKLEFPDREEIGLSKNYTGALIAMVFPKN